MKRYLIFALLMPFFLLRPACAQPSLKAEVNKVSLTTDQTFTYNLAVDLSGAEDKGQELEFPDFTDFHIVTKSESTQFSFAKDRIEKKYSYKFILRPQKTGKLLIGPSRLKIKDGELLSDSFEIEVSSGKRPIEPQEDRGDSYKPIPPTDEPQVTL